MEPKLFATALDPPDVILSVNITFEHDEPASVDDQAEEKHVIARVENLQNNKGVQFHE